MKELIKLAIENNPGMLTVLFSSITALGTVFLTYYFTTTGKDKDKVRDIEFKAKEELRNQEKIVYSSLSKILFDVQQLHVSLSGNCVDNACILDALKRFDTSVSKCHSDISDNMLYLSSEVINSIYAFYDVIGNLKIELKEIDKAINYEFANVTVYYASQHLAEGLIHIQEIFISQRSDLKIEFDKLKQEKMKYCCGQKPPEELEHRYKAMKDELIKKHIVTS